MDVRASLLTLVDRVAVGTPIDEAAAGLELGWDEHGNHATDFLAAPAVWRKLEPGELGALIDWFLAHGADGARMLERSVADMASRDAAPSPIRAHLLKRAALPDLAPALIAAFRARRLGLARTFLTHGADPVALGAWVEPDLVTPKALGVRYQASGQTQRVTLAMRLLRLQPGFRGVVPPCAALPRLFSRLGEKGLLGGALFEPRLSRVTEESLEEKSTPHESDVRAEFSVQGVAPAGLALVFRSWVQRNPHWYPIGIELVGEVPLANDAGTVTTERASSWYGSPDADPYGPPGALPFPVSAKPKKKTFAIVEHRDEVARSVHGLGLVLDPEMLQAPRVGFDADAPAPPSAHFDVKASGGKSEVVLKRFGPGAIPDPAPLRAALLHGLAALDGVTSVRWGDDAGVEDSAPEPRTPSPAKPTARSKRQKPASADLPDRGPSRIATLRQAAEGKRLPWAAVGAPAGAIPASLGEHALPPTLKSWLSAGDASWPLARDRPLQPRTFAELVQSEHPDLAEVLAPIGETLLAGPCLPLFVPSLCADGTLLFLHFPLADEHGEPPVIGFDPTDDGLVGVFAPRFDHYLARVLDVDRSAVVFAPGPLADPYLQALVGRLAPKERKKVMVESGVLAVGGLLG